MIIFVLEDYRHKITKTAVSFQPFFYRFSLFVRIFNINPGIAD